MIITQRYNPYNRQLEIYVNGKHLFSITDKMIRDMPKDKFADLIKPTYANILKWHQEMEDDLAKMDPMYYTIQPNMEKFFVATKYNKIEVILPQEQFKDIMNNPNMNFVVINHISQSLHPWLHRDFSEGEIVYALHPDNPFDVVDDKISSLIPTTKASLLRGVPPFIDFPTDSLQRF